jgi:2-(1,2-epoxy-1,2-dihydrophenyl)acetyl-CoA isomerase
MPMSRRFAEQTPYEGYEDAIVEKKDGVVVFTLNRPEKLNALSPALRLGLKRILEDVNDDDDAKVLVLTGAGRGFCSGADMAGPPNPNDAPPSRQVMEESRFGWIARFRSMRKPVLAAVNGVAAGGGFALTLACDVRIASDQARFITAFMRRAILPDQCSTWLLPHLVGTSRALLMHWLSDEVKAEEALRIGLADMVVPHADLMTKTMELANRLARGPSMTIELTKQAVYHAMGASLETHAEYEENLLNKVHHSEDVKEGRLAFREKRQPVFKGR